MSNADRAVDVFRSNASIISTIDCPRPSSNTIKVLFPREGSDPLRVICVQRPMSFDQICTVVVEGASSPPPWQPPPLRSVTDMLRRVYWHTRTAEAKYGAPLRFVRPVFDARSVFPNNFAHQFIHIIPLCLHARRCIGPDISFAFRKLDLRISELLSEFSLDPIITHKRIVGPIVHIYGTRGFAAYSLHDILDHDCPALSFLPDTYRQYEFKATIKYDKVFFTRRNVRTLENQSDVQRLLTERGYTTVHMEDFAVRDQISIAAHARHVVAIHGAAMGFLALNRDIESLIELFPPHVYHALFQMTLGSSVRKYVVVIQDFDERVIYNGWDAVLFFKNRPFEVNLGLLERALDEVERGKAPDDA